MGSDGMTLPFPVRFCESGPFAGRAYEVLPDGSTGRRRRDLEPHLPHATRADKARLAAMVAKIPDQNALDEILSRCRSDVHRAQILESWRKWLTFEPKEDESHEGV
jgi:hypothetical protein